MQTITSKNTSQNFKKKNKVYNYLPIGTKSVFDYGCGRYNHNKDFCMENNIEWIGYDPFWKTQEENDFAFQQLKEKTFDCFVCSNVLNVINDEKEITSIITTIKNFMNEDTVALFSCYSGNKTNIGKLTKNDCWQRNEDSKVWKKRLSSYFEILYIIGDIFVCILKKEKK